MAVDAIRLLLFPALMAFAASSDLFAMTIPNKVSLALVVGFFSLALMTGMSPVEIGSHAGAGAIVLLVAFGLFARGWIGGGDAKLAAATTLWLGFDQLLAYLFDACILGGILTLVLINLRLVPLPAALQKWNWARRLHEKNGGIPYGIALAAAALMAYPDTVWMKSLGG
jgi:prepilin peptidase CpaA